MTTGVTGGSRYQNVSKKSKFLPGENVHLGLSRAQAIQHLTMAIHRQGARTPHGELVDGVELNVPQRCCALATFLLRLKRWEKNM